MGNPILYISFSLIPYYVITNLEIQFPATITQLDITAKQWDQ